tara:strand:+ start:298 stop:450 length:153 start_codon:yes stop_codon:yes gene_type:complete
MYKGFRIEFMKKGEILSVDLDGLGGNWRKFHGVDVRITFEHLKDIAEIKE